jgi:UDP-N-acetylmuramoylalanine--D-glutamate ligase
MAELSGQRAVVMGLGRFGGGVGAARFCAERGAEVLVTDMLDASELSEPMGQLDDLPVRYRLGEHRLDDFTSADLVVVNPAVDRRENRYIDAARRHGARITSEIELLVERLPDRRQVIGVTGTAGKSTTTAMIGHILAQLPGEPPVHVGGNIGGSLLDRLGVIGERDRVVLELSSFMLEPMEGWSPHVAVVTNLGPNHLDRHGTLEAYAEAKRTILHHQRAEDHAVLGADLGEWQSCTSAHCVVGPEPPEGELTVPGEHNRTNAALAVEACTRLGLSRSACVEAVRSFPGLEHRLKLVHQVNGVRYFDDSKSTTPDSAMRGIDSFPPGAVRIILGGYDKGADLGELARYAARRCAGVYTVGDTGPAIAEAAEAACTGGETGSAAAVHRCGSLERAVERAGADAEPGEVVLLSPGCASWDRFTNYEARGRFFSELALRHRGGR